MSASTQRRGRLYTKARPRQRCERCSQPFRPYGRQRFCSHRCRDEREREQREQTRSLPPRYDARKSFSFPDEDRTGKPYAEGEKRRVQAGYIMVKYGGLLWPEHRLVLGTALGRWLTPGETVHHRNGDRADNRRENLELWIGAHGSGQRASEVVCPHCGRRYMA